MKALYDDEPKKNDYGRAWQLWKKRTEEEDEVALHQNGKKKRKKEIFPQARSNLLLPNNKTSWKRMKETEGMNVCRGPCYNTHMNE